MTVVLRLRFSAAARRDLHQAAAWYLGVANLRVKQRFLIEINRAFSLLLEQPLMGAPSAAGTRKWVITGFPYSVIYRVDGDSLWVEAVMHHRRHPEAGIR